MILGNILTSEISNLHPSIRICQVPLPPPGSRQIKPFTPSCLHSTERIVTPAQLLTCIVEAFVAILQAILVQPPTGHLASHPAGELQKVLHGVAEQTCLHVTDVFEQVLMSQGAEEHVFWLAGLLVGPLVGGFIVEKGSST